jgi:predicted transcriptional regulator
MKYIQKKQNYRSPLELIYEALGMIANGSMNEPIPSTYVLYLFDSCKSMYDAKMKFLIERDLVEVIINEPNNFRKTKATKMLKLTEKGKVVLDRLHRLNQICNLDALDHTYGYYAK